jgi:hypothetical protein
MSLYVVYQSRFESYAALSQTISTFRPRVPLLITIFSIATVTYLTPRAIAISLAPAVVPFLVHLVLSSSFSKKITPSLKQRPNETSHGVDLSISVRVIVVLLVVLGIQAVAFGPFYCPLPQILFAAIPKALTWFSLLQLIYSQSDAQFPSEGLQAPVSFIMAVWAFVTTSLSKPSAQSSDIRALCFCIASLAALGQIVYTLPRQTHVRFTLAIFAFVPLVPYLANLAAIQHATTSAQQLSSSREHPVDTLIRSAHVDFEHLTQRQSKTYEAACDEYRRRYGKEPPPGFEGWYEFAVAHQSPIIDDFDAIYDAVSPLWKLSGQEVSKAVDEAKSVPNSELWRCEIRNTDTECFHRFRTNDRNIAAAFDRLLVDIRGALPDIDLLVNHLDEPRVLFPPLKKDEPRVSLEWENLSREPVLDALTKHCDHSSATSDMQLTDLGLPFVSNISSTVDLCAHPEYLTMHGLILSPNSFRLIKGPVPVLSTGSLSTMGDTLMPSPAYIDQEFVYEDVHDVNWDQKRNNMYWAGTMTGGIAEDDRWRAFHRHRFVSLVTGIDPRQYSYLRETDGLVGVEKSPFLNGRLFDVSATKIKQCRGKYCRDQDAYLNPHAWAPKDQALRSRLVFDLDGNGISGRFYRLLASKSTPLKQTILKEWHDERLVPWVHYVPVSLGMEELPELVTFLTSTDKGRDRAKNIAEQGREWFSKALREVDMTIYMYRLILELNRLQDATREAG